MKKIFLLDLPQIPASQFRYDNSICYARAPCLITLDGTWRSWRSDVKIIGWNWLKGNPLMNDREGNVAVMMEVNGEELWEHLPVYDDIENCTLWVADD